MKHAVKTAVTSAEGNSQLLTSQLLFHIYHLSSVLVVTHKTQHGYNADNFFYMSSEKQTKQNQKKKMYQLQSKNVNFVS